MLIEIITILSTFISGYLIGKNQYKPKHLLHKLSCRQQLNIQLPIRNQQIKQQNQTVQLMQVQKISSNKKKKNKKKKKENQMLQEIKEEEENQKLTDSRLRETKQQGDKIQSGSKSQKTQSSQRISQIASISKSCQFPSIQSSLMISQEQLLLKKDLILDQLQVLRNYFLTQMNQIIPYSPINNHGLYNLVLNGTSKQLSFQWSYNNSKYPDQLIELNIIYDTRFNPLEIDRLNQIIKYHQEQFQKHNDYFYLFQLMTNLYQDMLMQVMDPNDDQIDLTLQKKDNLANNKTLNIPSQHDTSRMFTQDKKQIYGKLLEQIFYMQDFKQQPNDSLLINHPAQNIQNKYHSRGRYANEFQQMQMVGQGGFGKVYKAKNRLDSNTYAIKKIVINYQSSSDRKLLKQVTLLSKLNHPNIVRYHQSWLEDTNTISQLINDMSITQSEQKQQLKIIYEGWKKSKKGIIFVDDSNNNQNNRKRKNKNQNNKNNKSKKKNITEDSSDTDSQEDYIESDLNNDTDSDGIMFQQGDDGGIQFGECSQIQFQASNPSQNRNRKLSFPKLKSSQHSQSLKSHAQISQQSSSQQFPFKILYIVMQFCQGINLKQFLTSHFHQQQLKIQIIRGILQGLSYIHQRKIIHRDLKPANIFLTQNNKVKIGDFGLATIGAFQEKTTGKQYKQKDFDQWDKTVGIGTAFYRAPEQLKSTKYDQKVDIYSLGIIIFEMFYQFSTYSQRFKILSEITKSFRLPKNFNLYGQITDYQISIEFCIKEQAEFRPTARRLLQNFRNKYFVLLVSAIANPKYAQFYQLVKHLFQISNQRRVQNIKKNYLRNYNAQPILKIFSIHRGVIFPCLPLTFSNDHKSLNSFKILFPANRKHKYMVMSQQGVLLEYVSNLYQSWIIYAKETMRKRKTEIWGMGQKVNEMRRFTFQKIIQPQDQKKDQTVFREKYVTGFDICYDLEDGFQPFYTLQMLIISQNVTQTLQLSQDPPLYLCHSKIFTILSKHYKIPQVKLFSCLLLTTQQKMSQTSIQKKLQYFQKYQIQGTFAKKLCTLLDNPFESIQQLLHSLDIPTIQQYTQYWQILQQFTGILSLHSHFNLLNPQYKLMIPPNSCNGIFWMVGGLKGFTSVEDYNLGAMNGYLCNLNLEINMTHAHQQTDVSVWSNQEYLEAEIMEVISKCWSMGTSVKYYQQGIGEKDQTAKMNMIIKKKKGQKRVYYNIRNNQPNRKQPSQTSQIEQNRKQVKHKNKCFNQQIKQSNKQLSVVLKQHFNHQVFRQLHIPYTTSIGNAWGKRKSDSG